MHDTYDISDKHVTVGWGPTNRMRTFAFTYSIRLRLQMPREFVGGSACVKKADDTLWCLVLLEQGGSIALMINQRHIFRRTSPLLTPTSARTSLTPGWNGNLFSQCVSLTSAWYIPLLACCYGYSPSAGCSDSQSVILLPVKAGFSGHTKAFHLILTPASPSHPLLPLCQLHAS